MQQSQITIVGNLGTDPLVNVSSKGVSWTSFRVVSTTRNRNEESGEWVDGDTTWHTVKVFNKLAENTGLSARKGDEVIVVGQMVTEEWVNKDGEPRTTTAVKADSIGLSLSRQRAQVMKVGHTAAAESPDVAVPDDASSLSTPPDSPAPRAETFALSGGEETPF